MAQRRTFNNTVTVRVDADPAFRAALLQEAVNLMIEGDVETGKTVLRDYINATVGFEALAAEVGTPSKSHMRMFGPKGNPRAENLFSVISHLQKATGVHLAVGTGAQ